MNVFELFFRLGWQHIISPDAKDHLLFLAALTVVFSFKELKKLLLLISVFTVSHTAALALTAYGVVKINEMWVEKAIVLTIIITALSNILIHNRDRLQRWHIFFVAFFGLIHGAGFTHAFLMSVSGMDDLLYPLLSFAAGIETGQIFFIIVFLSLIRIIFVKILKVSETNLIKCTSFFILGFALSMF